MLKSLLFRASVLLNAVEPSTFVWSENIGKILSTALLSMVPTFEGRYAVVVGMGMGMPMVFAFFLALIFSTLPMPLIMLFLKPLLKWIYTLPIQPLKKFVAWVEKRSLRKAEKVDTSGLLGLFLFVAVPLPGTGVWTGTAIATLLNMKRSHAAIAIFLGNVVACLLMTLAAYGVVSIF